MRTKTFKCGGYLFFGHRVMIDIILYADVLGWTTACDKNIVSHVGGGNTLSSIWTTPATAKYMVSAAGATSSAPSIIPFSRNDYFVGRESQLAELEAKLFGGERTTRLAIVGPGGTGNHS